MPKYYRFRATTPTRKSCRSKTRDREREAGDKDETKNRYDAEPCWVDLTLTCPTPSWYLRRTGWRETPAMLGLPRQITNGLRTSLQFNNRPVFLINMPNVRPQGMSYL